MIKPWIPFVALAFGLAGCSKSPSDSGKSRPADEASLAIQGIPVTLTVKQRSTTGIPGSDEKLSITTGDITRGQVMVHLIPDAGGAAILGPVSMRRGNTREFQFANTPFLLTLKELNNALIGEDFATFVISAPGKGARSEDEKIQHLITAVEALESAVFIRNGTEYSPKEGADHLRRKLEAASDQIDSASAFIDRVATKSSTTGEAYTVRLANGETIAVGDFLREALAALQPRESP